MSSPKQKIMIIEPSVIVKEGLTAILKESGQFDMVSCPFDEDAIADFLIDEKPQILIINPTLMSYTKRFDFRNSDTDNPQMVWVALLYQYVESAVLSSYQAVLDIRESKEEILNTLQHALQTEKTSAVMMDNYELSDREKEVLAWVAKGLMNKEIADKLNISVHTVITHRKNITKKTGIKSVAGLTVYAMMNNL